MLKGTRAAVRHCQLLLNSLHLFCLIRLVLKKLMQLLLGEGVNRLLLRIVELAVRATNGFKAVVPTAVGAVVVAHGTYD
jgi:hypothetical protein